MNMHDMHVCTEFSFIIFISRNFLKIHSPHPETRTIRQPSLLAFPYHVTKDGRAACFAINTIRMF